MYNLSVVEFQKRRQASFESNTLVQEAAKKIEETKTNDVTTMKELVERFLNKEITPEDYKKQLLQLDENWRDGHNKVVRATHKRLYEADARTHNVCSQMMEICGIYLNKTVHVDVDEQTYADADNDVLRALYTVVYGDRRRAGILVHACKQTCVPDALTKRYKSKIVQRLLSALCLHTTEETQTQNQNETKTESSPVASPRGTVRILHMPVVDALLVETFNHVLEDEIKVASVCARNCQNSACGKRITANIDMVTSGAKLTCPTCQQAQDITMNELESYQTKQATEMRCAKRCAISFENDRELFTNVMFADSLLLPEEQDAGKVLDGQEVNDTESKTATQSSTQSSTHASSLRSSLKLNSTEHMDDIWERARRYGGDGEWTFATGQGPTFFQRGTMEDTRRHFRVLTGGLSVEKVITKDQGSKYEMKCQSCQNILSSTCDIGTLLAAGERPCCGGCQSTNLIQLPTKCTYQDTVMGIVHQTLENVPWVCECQAKNDAIHAWCQQCEASRSLASIQQKATVCEPTAPSTCNSKEMNKEGKDEDWTMID